MADTTNQTQPKRQRRDAIEALEKEEEEASKRHKNSSSHNNLMSILDEDENDDVDDDEKPVQDFSAILAALQQELCSSPASGEVVPGGGPAIAPVMQATSSKEDENGDKCVIRHLREASDDELGIPTSGDGGKGNGKTTAGGGADLPAFSLSDGLWDLEDESANYYSLLHSQLFM